MADKSEEDIIIIEDSDAAYDNTASTQETEEVSGSLVSDKKKLIFIAAGVAVIAIVIIIALIVQKSSKKPQEISTQRIEEKLKEDSTKPLEPSKIENMIAKADYLYSTGSKVEALFLYEKIPTTVKAKSPYNPGVAQQKMAKTQTE